MGPFQQAVEEAALVRKGGDNWVLRLSKKELKQVGLPPDAMSGSKITLRSPKSGAKRTVPIELKEEIMGPFEREVENRHKAELVTTPEFPRLYAEYIAHTEDISIEEAARRSLARIFDIFTDPMRNAAIITAFRGENDLPTNRRLNRSLMRDIRRQGYGFTPVTGGWVEQTDDGGTREVEEESLVVSGPVVETMYQDGPVEAPGVASAEQFQADILRWVRKYEQEGGLLKLAGSTDAVMLNPDGSSFTLGQWRLNDAAKYYTKMKGGGQRGRKIEFAFECAGSEDAALHQRVQRFFEDRAKLEEQGFAIRPSLSTGSPQMVGDGDLWSGRLEVLGSLDAALKHIRSHEDVQSAEAVTEFVLDKVDFSTEQRDVDVKIRASSADAARGKLIELSKV